MSGDAKTITAAMILVLCYLSLNIVEVFWLRAKQWGTTGTAAGFAIVTNFVGFGIGLFISFFVFGVMLAASWDPGHNPFKDNEIVMTVLVIIGTLIPPLFLLLSKRIMLGLLKMRAGWLAWIYSLVTAVLIYVLTVAPAVLFLYLFRA